MNETTMGDLEKAVREQIRIATGRAVGQVTTKIRASISDATAAAERLIEGGMAREEAIRGAVRAMVHLLERSA